jgi:hypothetical protein
LRHRASRCKAISGALFLCALGGCHATNDLAPRTLIGDGQSAVVPLAAYETVFIEYSLPGPDERSGEVIIMPDGLIQYWSSDVRIEWKMLVAQKRLLPADFAKLRKRLEDFRPPEDRLSIKAPNSIFGGDNVFEPMGCSRPNVDNSRTIHVLVFLHGKTSRRLLLRSECKTGAAARLTIRLKSLLNEPPLDVGTFDLAFSS